MLISISLIGFALAALTYAGLGALLVIRGAPTSTGRLFIAAIVAQIAWGATIATAMAGRPLPVALIASVEAARLFLWIAFLLSLVRSARPEDSGSSMQRSASTGLVAAATIAAGMLAIDVFAFGERPAFTVRVIAAVFALVCLEQVYRNTPPGRRWAMKFLAVALVALFGFDLVMYSEALMFSRLNPALWSARGYANALLAPLLAIAAARNRNWKLEISVSRQVVFHSTTLSAAGLYLLLMAAAGYWVRLFGGDWGAVVQALILFVAAIGAVVMLMSGTLRARLRVFLAKNFFSYRFDYRAEWLRLTQLLAEAPETGQGAAAETDPLEVRAIRGLAALVESTGGALWMRNEDGQFVCAARVRFAANTPAIPATHPMSVFLRDRQWVVSLPEWRENPERYDRLTLPDALTDHPDNWLIVPLMLHEELLGFVVLTRPLAATEVNWEVRDALKAAARQVASYLGVRRAVESLVQARQFESFNRMSAFVVHDLKNLVAQLALLLANAERHRDNPEFQQDMLDTIANVQGRMEGLLMQLRAGTRPIEAPTPLPVGEVVLDAIRSKRVEAPSVDFTIDPALRDATVLAHRDRLERVIGHLIQNAAEASARNASIHVRVTPDDGRVSIEVQDRGKGMSEQFIRERLFKPFQSSKAHGMGIGTFESREYIRELGGSLEVDSSENVGTTFRIRLPLAVSVVPA